MVILRCFMVLNLNRFKSYDTKCNYIFPDLANSRNVNGHSSTISSQFSAFYINSKYYSQNWISNGHFELLKGSEPQKVMAQNVNHMGWFWICRRWFSRLFSWGSLLLSFLNYRSEMSYVTKMSSMNCFLSRILFSLNKLNSLNNLKVASIPSIALIHQKTYRTWCFSCPL